LRHDAISGDYAQNFFGHALNTATYIIQHPEFGWQAFGGNVAQRAQVVAVTPLDSFRSRVYLAPLGLWLTLDAGQFERVEFRQDTRRVRVALAAAGPFTPAARLRIEQPATLTGVGVYAPVGKPVMECGAFVIPLASTTTWVELSAPAK
jgi:hypothetical protein